MQGMGCMRASTYKPTKAMQRYKKIGKYANFCTKNYQIFAIFKR